MEPNEKKRVAVLKRLITLGKVAISACFSCLSALVSRC